MSLGFFIIFPSEVISSINSYFAEDKAVEETQNNQGALAID